VPHAINAAAAETRQARDVTVDVTTTRSRCAPKGFGDRRTGSRLREAPRGQIVHALLLIGRAPLPMSRRRHFFSPSPPVGAGISARMLPIKTESNFLLVRAGCRKSKFKLRAIDARISSFRVLPSGCGQRGRRLMHALSRILQGTAVVALAVVSQARAATLVPVTPPPGATLTIVFGINKHAVIAGAYNDANSVTHGFFGPLNGTYTSFDYGGASTGTVPRALNDDGDITGFAPSPGLYLGTEFLRQADGTIVTFEKNGVPLDGVAQGIIKKGETSTGDYVIDPNTGLRTGYLANEGIYQTDVMLNLGELTTNPRSLNKHGTLAGFYLEQDGRTTHGFILKDGVVQVIDADESGTTALEGINKKELATGQVIDADGNPHSFVYNNETGVFTTIDIPDGSKQQQAWGINDKGQVAVSTDIGASYIYCTRDVLCPHGGKTVADGRTWRAGPGASLHYDSHGRTGVKAITQQRLGVIR
jgi:hypothetical protein